MNENFVRKVAALLEMSVARLFPQTVDKNMNLDQSSATIKKKIILFKECNKN